MLIHPHVDYECSSWYPPLKKNLKIKLQKDQNKCIRFCLNLPPRSHIDPSHFGKINWLLASDKVKYCMANTIFMCWHGIVPVYIHKIFKSWLCRYNRRSQIALDIPLRKTNTGRKGFSFLGPKIWSKINPSVKNAKISSSFLHALKKNLLLHLQT